MATGQNVKLAPYVSKLLLETDQVKIYEARLEPGERNEFHCHPNYFVYNMTDNHIRTVDLSRKTKDHEFKKGESGFFRMQAHMAQNIGQGPAQMLIVELKMEPKK
jgi:hypothetical protein